jgi:hypothetical protein
MRCRSCSVRLRAGELASTTSICRSSRLNLPQFVKQERRCERASGSGDPGLRERLACVIFRRGFRLSKSIEGMLQVASYSEDHPQDDALNALWNDLNRRVFSLIHSNQSFEIRGGITAIDRLLETKKDVAPEKHMQRVLRFYHCERCSDLHNDFSY